MRQILSAVLTVGLVLSAAVSAEDVNLDVMTKIKDEGFNRSQVMETLGYLTDNIGPRLTGTPALKEANHWTKGKLEEWGLKNSHLEGFEFGRGWTLNKFQVIMTSPRSTQVDALPISWLPGTEGVLEGDIIYAPIKQLSDFEQYEGKLKGKIVFLSRVPDPKEPRNKVFSRYDEDALKDIAGFDVPLHDEHEAFEELLYKVVEFGHKLDEFLVKEGAIARVHRPGLDGMMNSGTDYQYLINRPSKTPGVSIVAEHYDRAVRLLNKGEKVSFSLDVDVSYHEEDSKSYSTFAEIPGKGSNPQIVMAGAHLDSWFAGDGAVDNGAGVAVVMEAVRILQAIGIKPKNTVRVALWGGEEQGLFGSLQYVHDHFATRPDGTDERRKYMAPIGAQLFGGFPIEKKKDYERFSLYLNLDNGSGKIRGIYAENNLAAAKVFEEWLKPFHALGAETVSIKPTDKTDHVVFDRVGLPGFQFIQDPLDYNTRLHHTKLDVFNHAYEKDLKQAAVIMAGFLYNAAMSDAKFPRKPFPTAPNVFVKSYETSVRKN